MPIAQDEKGRETLFVNTGCTPICFWTTMLCVFLIYIIWCHSPPPPPPPDNSTTIAVLVFFSSPINIAYTPPLYSTPLLVWC